MAHFSLPNSNQRFFISVLSTVEKLAIQRPNSVVVQQWGTDASGKMPALSSSEPNLVKLTIGKTDGNRRLVTIKAQQEGKVTLSGKDVWPLTVYAGEFKKHDDMVIDLLAEKLGRSSDPFKIFELQRLLGNSEDNRFNQRSAANKKRYDTELGCGSVCANEGQFYFGKGQVSERYFTYHKPIQTIEADRKNVIYPGDTIEKAARAIQRELKSQRAVRVGTFWSAASAEVQKGYITPSRPGGHFVLIVGCNAAATKFLYIDPWLGGSRMTYLGGVTIDPYKDCEQMGLLVTEKVKRGGTDTTILRQHRDTEGAFGGSDFLEVIAGPV